MKTAAYFGWRAYALILTLMVVLAAASCGGGGGGTVGLGDNQTPGGGDSSTSNVTRGTGQIRTIHEQDIPSLPKWQQELLSDPGWNQPGITPRADTPMPAPTYEMLMESTKKAIDTPVVTDPFVGHQADTKGASWNDQGGYVAPTVVDPGEYDTLYAGAVPYGCKDGPTANGHSRERNIATAGIPLEAPQTISWVLEGKTNANTFNSAGGAGNDSRSCVYQLYCTDRAANPQKPYGSYGEDLIPVFAEVSYRSDGGAGSPGACGGSVTAYAVRRYFWWRFNSDFAALPGGNKTKLYNVLVAPSSDQSSTDTSFQEDPSGTDGRIQNFYLGDVSGCYGGGAIVSLSSAASGCTAFDDLVNDPDNVYTLDIFTNPIYGVLLKRWQDSVLSSMPGGSQPWDGDFGWPVNPPVTYNGGSAVLTGQGAYYAWGMYFERGFIWWIDYVNNTNVPDEAQAYAFTGKNVFCADKQTYNKIPTIFYGGGGALGVSVIVEASLNPDRGPGTRPPAASMKKSALARMA